MTLYYKTWHILLQNAAVILLQNASDFLLQNATVIVRCDVCYKMCHYIRAIDKATELSSVITI